MQNTGMLRRLQEPFERRRKMVQGSTVRLRGMEGFGGFVLCCVLSHPKVAPQLEQHNT